MQSAYHILSALLSALFVYYGAACIWSSAMVEEFERFGLARFRVLTGVLEILGAIGLAIGFFVPVLRVAAAIGLCVLMSMGALHRIRQRDSLPEMAPALLFALLTLWIAVYGATQTLDQPHFLL